MSETTKEEINAALQLHQAGRLVEAEILYSKILDTEPENANTLNLLGLLKIQTKQFEEAIRYIKKAVEIKPTAYYLESLGRAYLETENFTEAINNFEKSLQLKPDDFDVLFNLAFAYKNNKQFDKAIEIYQSALKIKPKSTDVYYNIANAYENKNETEKALENFQKVLEYNFQDDTAYYFIGISQLKLKNFKQGWEYYEVRPCKKFGIITQEKQYKELITSTSMWTGESLDNKTIFIYYEAAFGDTLMYARYIPYLKSKWPSAKILFRPQSSLATLFRDSDLGAEIFDLNTPPEKVVFDTHIPLMSLPYVLEHNSEDDIPYPEGFLKSNPQKVKEYKAKFFNNDKLKIGIKWQGNPAYDTCRIIPIESFYKLFELPNTKFYSLQKDDGAEELDKLPKDFELVDLGATFNDFSDTAAAIENLDLVICNDTSVAHLVCAMGKPCWIMLPFVSNWRWHMDLSYSPWYKSAKLFKQIEHDNWEEVFDRALIGLKALQKLKKFS